MKDFLKLIELLSRLNCFSVTSTAAILF